MTEKQSKEIRADKKEAAADRKRSERLLEIIRWDYLRVFEETGIPPEWAEVRSRETADQVPMPEGFDHIRIAPSPIAGLGLYTEKPIRQGEIIGPARIAGMRTPLGRYANHSPWPNTEFVQTECGGLNSIALCDIPSGAEILNNYRQGAWIWGATFDAEKVQETVSALAIRLKQPLEKQS